MVMREAPTFSGGISGATVSLQHASELPASSSRSTGDTLDVGASERPERVRSASIEGTYRPGAPRQSGLVEGESQPPRAEVRKEQE